MGAEEMTLETCDSPQPVSHKPLKHYMGHHLHLKEKEPVE